MPRIGRQIPHFESVSIESIHAVFSSDKRFRYLLSMSFKDNLLETGRDKTAVVILKNPSSADELKADATIRKVETFVYHRFQDVRYLHIVNIFAFRATDPYDLNEACLAGGAMEVIGEENDHVIRKTLEECEYAILAWGNNSGIEKNLYEERIYRMKQLIHELPGQKVFQIVGQRKTKHPLHGLMWGYNYSIQTIQNYLDQA